MVSQLAHSFLNPQAEQENIKPGEEDLEKVIVSVLFSRRGSEGKNGSFCGGKLGFESIETLERSSKTLKWHCSGRKLWTYSPFEPSASRYSPSLCYFRSLQNFYTVPFCTDTAVGSLLGPRLQGAVKHSMVESDFLKPAVKMVHVQDLYLKYIYIYTHICIYVYVYIYISISSAWIVICLYLYLK